MSDVTAAVEDSANLAVHQLQNSFTNLETHTGAVILNKLQSLDVSYQTSSGPLNIMGKLLSSLSCKGKCIVSCCLGIEEVKEAFLSKPAIYNSNISYLSNRLFAFYLRQCL